MRELTDADGTVTDTYVYRAFGAPRASTGSTTNRFRYIGKLGYYHEAALASYYLRRRYYTPEVRRFVSRDPVRQDGVNAYAYVAYRPTKGAAPLRRWIEPVGRRVVAESEGVLRQGEAALASWGRNSGMRIRSGHTRCDYIEGKAIPWVSPAVPRCMEPVVAQHEDVHVNQMAACCALAAKCIELLDLTTCVRAYDLWEDLSKPGFECEAYGLYTLPWVSILPCWCRLRNRRWINDMKAARQKACQHPYGHRTFPCPFNADGSLRKDYPDGYPPVIPLD